MKSLILFLSATLLAFPGYSQETGVSGEVRDSYSNEPLPDVIVRIDQSNMEILSDAQGRFVFSGMDLPRGEQILSFSKIGYISQRVPITIKAGETTALSPILLKMDPAAVELQVGVISLSDEELDGEEGSAYNISGLLQASRDVFLNAAAFDFSSTFFRPKGYGSEYGKVFINGLEMNKLFDGRPQWSNWGGLNDAQRNQEFSMGLTPNEYDFGNLAGTTNIIMRASQYRKGGRLSYASSNRSYRGRLMASYNSGLTPGGWAFSLLLARRFAEEGYRDGTLYDANSFFGAVERKFDSHHSLNLTAFYTPNRRGKSSANTQEVYDIKGTRYNSYWGHQDGEIRNSRIKEVAEPVIMLNHFWDFSENTQLNTNIGYQFGKIGNSRLGYTNAPNPDPSYYQKLPNFFLSNSNGPDYEGAFRAYSSFLNDGQINWTQLYKTNILYAGPSRYYLYEDRNDDKQWMANTIFYSQISSRIILTASVNYKNLSSRNFANMIDLLGGEGFLDLDTFNLGDAAQSDLNNPDRLVFEDDIFKYNYTLDATEYGGFAQSEFSFSRFQLYLAGKASKTEYQRTGLYRNGSYPEGNDSFGPSDKLDFTTYGIKFGGSFNVTGRHILQLNASYFTQPPTLRNSFSNARQNNATVIGLLPEKISNLDGSYIFRSPLLKARLSGYYTTFNDASEISFFYADGIAVEGRTATTAFIQEVLTNISRKHLGGELGVEAQVLPTLLLKGAAAYGQHIYANNPELYITSDDFSHPQFYGKSYLKNYRLAGGPQQAYQIGFEYRHPEFWWFGATVNYFSNAYIDVSPLARTKNFYLDVDGMPFNDYSPELAKELLRQEEFHSYFLVNAVGGKSWKIKSYFLGFFASINNILNQEYKTGGYEQGRNANFKTLSKDFNSDSPVFGPKYWFGYGTTYYVNFYLRF